MKLRVVGSGCPTCQRLYDMVQALIAKGMHAGPALALLLAGPSLSLPNMLVVRSVLGTKKTVVYVSLVVVYATIGGFVYGLLV